MTEQQLTVQARQGSAPPQPPSLPDLNSGKYPFELVFKLLQEAGYFNMLAVNRPLQPVQVIRPPGNPNTVVGIQISNDLHRFDISLYQPASGSDLIATNQVGQRAGKFEHQWVIIPDGFVALPDAEPPAVPLDTSKSQRFVMRKGAVSFGDGQDGFSGFGTGRTYPITSSGKTRLLVGAVGEVIQGFGILAGLRGTYVVSGEISIQHGFQGNVQCRFMDPDGRLSTEAELPSLEAERNPVSGLTYIMFRGQKKDANEKTNYIIGPNGMPQGFKLGQELRDISLDFSTGGRRGLRSKVVVNQVVGSMTSQVFLNLFNPGAPGTSLAPIPFSSLNQFTLVDRNGKELGSFVAEGGEGRTFNEMLQGAPGQAALRFGAFQRLTKGTGWFAGVQGILTDNSIVGVSPHVTLTLYTLCIDDPQGKYRGDVVC